MATSTEWATSGVELLVEVRGGNATVLSAARVPNVPRLDLMAPLMTEENLPRLRSDDRELVLTIIGPTGRNPTSFGFPVVARQYFDFRDAATGLTRGGPRPIRPDEPDLRAIRLPWSADCTAILLHTTAVGADYSTSHERRLVVSGVTLYQADTQRAVAGPMPPGIPVERPLDLPWLPEWAPDTVRPVPYGPADAWTADGRFVGWDSPVLVGDPARCFDIMITGDGFTDAEMPQFDEWAVKLREGLQKVEPFQSLARYINWHVARVASTDSGIDQCPDPRDPSHKRTFFGVEGGWNNSDCPGYMGLHHVPRLMWVAEQGCGWEHLEVALVIANCSTWGGHSWPAAKTAIVPGLPWALVGLAAHEVGHTISRLAEEYISCVEDEPRHGEHNLARLPEVSASVKRRLEIVSGRLLRWAPADTVWWKLLATRPGEVRSDDTFKWVHVLGDPVQPGKSVKPSMPAACPDDAIGAFWGCQNGVDRNELVNLVAAMCTLSATDVEAVIATMQATTGFQPNRPSIEPADSCDQSWDPRGAFFFRPSPTCCMRSPLPPRFCRVCEHLTRNAILERCGLAPCEPLPPPPACP